MPACPALLLVNKMDRENASFSRAVTDIQASFGSQCVPFQLPIGDAQDFQGVVSIINPPAEIPAAVADDFAAARERLIEAVAESDDALADKYLEGEELTAAEIIAGAKTAIQSGDLIPILACSATQNIGVSEYLDTIRDFFPSPEEGAKPAVQDSSGQAVEFAVDAAGPLTAFVFKTTADPFVGKLSLFRVYRGAISSNSEVWNSARNQAERIGQLYLPRGKSQENIAEVTAGDIGAIGKLAATVTGDTLCAREQPLSFAPIRSPAATTASPCPRPPKPTSTKCPLPWPASSKRIPVSAIPGMLTPATASSPAWATPRLRLPSTGSSASSAPTCCSAAPKSPTGRPSAGSPTPSTATRNSPAATASTAMCCCGWSRWSGTTALSSAPKLSAAGCRGSISRRWKRGVVKSMEEGVSPAFRWLT